MAQDVDALLQELRSCTWLHGLREYHLLEIALRFANDVEAKQLIRQFGLLHLRDDTRRLRCRDHLPLALYVDVKCWARREQGIDVSKYFGHPSRL